MDDLFKQLGDTLKPIEVMFTKEEMKKWFKAGVDFGRDMFTNPSNSEYINELILKKKESKDA